MRTRYVRGMRTARCVPGTAGGRAGLRGKRRLFKHQLAERVGVTHPDRQERSTT